MPRPDATPPARTTARKGSPRTKPAPERRRDLLDAGIAVFGDRGVAAATVDQITRAAGVAKGTFYLHFETKEHLLAALQADVETRLVDRVDAAAREAGDPASALAAWVDAAFAQYPDDLAPHDVLFHHPALPGGTTGAPRRELVDSLAELIGRGRDAGVFAVDDVEPTATLLCGALHRVLHRIGHRDAGIAPDRIRTATQALFTRAVALRPAPAR